MVSNYGDIITVTVYVFPEVFSMLSPYFAEMSMLSPYFAPHCYSPRYAALTFSLLRRLCAVSSRAMAPLSMT
jgi:hypothetical protein